ncbi:MAG: hypothetical protein RR268_01855 [Kiritimatiellia bacterium]
MKRPTQFDFAYAVRHTEILRSPKQLLDPFDQTVINYTLLAQPMDNPRQTRIREGKLQTLPPRLFLPGELSVQELEGFGPQSQKYLEFLHAHAASIRVLRYSYRLRRETFSETLLNEPLAEVRARVEKATALRADPYGAFVVGVDEPWDVCLLHLFMQLVQASVPNTIQALEARSKETLREAIPTSARAEIEGAFLAASKDSSLLKPLGKLLKDKGLFELYQDRFFALFEAR